MVFSKILSGPPTQLPAVRPEPSLLLRGQGLELLKPLLHAVRLVSGRAQRERERERERRGWRRERYGSETHKASVGVWDRGREFEMLLRTCSASNAWLSRTSFRSWYTAKPLATAKPARKELNLALKIIDTMVPPPTTSVD